MSTLKEALVHEDAVNPVSSSISELGVVISQTSKVNAADESDKLSKVHNSIAGEKSKAVDDTGSSLEKQQKNVNTIVREDIPKVQSSIEQVDENKENKHRSKILELINEFKQQKYTGNLCPLRSRLPDLKNAESGVPPPEPRIKRLKGNLAKTVGSKIDGCDWLMFHPYLDISHYEASKDHGQK